MKRPSAALVVATLALCVSIVGTGAAASHYLITSTHQIKPSVLAQLRGRTGPRGATGAAGTFTASDLHVVAGTQVTLGISGSSSASGTAYATCPAGSSVVSGGYSTNLIDGHLTIDQPYGDGWAVTAINDDFIATPYIQAIAACAS